MNLKTTVLSKFIPQYGDVNICKPCHRSELRKNIYPL